MLNDDKFDKAFNRLSGVFIAVWVVSALASLALIGAVIWGIVKIVGAVAG